MHISAHRKDRAKENAGDATALLKILSKQPITGRLGGGQVAPAKLRSLNRVFQYFTVNTVFSYSIRSAQSLQAASDMI